ncbi:MAG: hypothetical protein RLZZ501_158 [Pseudomonadota bacterium]
MILDARNQFAAATALNTGAAGTYLVGNVIDLAKNGLDVGNGEEMWLVILISTTATSGGAATATFKLASDAQAAIATDGSASVHIVTDTIPVASLVAGKQVCAIALPRGTYERYLGVLQVTGTAAFTAGAVTAFLTHDVAGWVAYPDAVSYS